jgi:hypothetical protein
MIRERGQWSAKAVNNDASLSIQAPGSFMTEACAGSKQHLNVLTWRHGPSCAITTESRVAVDATHDEAGWHVVFCRRRT